MQTQRPACCLCCCELRVHNLVVAWSVDTSTSTIYAYIVVADKPNADEHLEESLLVLYYTNNKTLSEMYII